MGRRAGDWDVDGEVVGGPARREAVGGGSWSDGPVSGGRVEQGVGRACGAEEGGSGAGEGEGATARFFHEALTRTVSPGSLLTFEIVPPVAWASSTRPTPASTAKTHTAPALLLSTGPPTMAVLPSAERDKEKP